MKELAEIVQAWEQAKAPGGHAALATVVRVYGSAYRRPGARMLILPDGKTIGSVSGGCLEADVIARAEQVMQTGQSETVIYDTTQDNDLLFGLGLGCQGTVHVLIERLATEDDVALTWPQSLTANHEPGVLATVYDAETGARIKLGERLLLPSEGQAKGQMALRSAAERALEAKQSESQTLAVLGGQVEVFSEYLRPPQPLVIFGAGNDAQPLVQLAKILGWHVTVVDSRPAFATTARFPGADAVLVTPRDVFPASICPSADAAIVVMTHHYLHDRAILESLLPVPVRYLGVLGPKRRTDRLLQELREDDLNITPQFLSSLHSPCGLDIGADTPEQIALAIVSEIQAVMTQRDAGFLRDRNGPIYDIRDVASRRSPQAVTERPRCAVSA